MPQRDIAVWPFRAYQRVFADHKGVIGVFRLKIGLAALFTDRHMAAIAAGIGNGMAYLAGECITVLIVHRVVGFARRSIRMTADTGRIFIPRKTVVHRLGAAMQFDARMAFDAIHPAFPEMDVPGEPFILSQVLVSNTAAVAGGAGAGHGWGFFKDMAIEQTTAHIFGLGHMAFTASGVAGAAMVAEHGLQRWMIFRNRTGIDLGPVSGLSVVQGIPVGIHLILMAISASDLWIFAGAWIHAGMGFFFNGGLDATMAISTGYSSVGGCFIFVERD